jgi:hypothetical protein
MLAHLPTFGNHMPRNGIVAVGHGLVTPDAIYEHKEGIGFVFVKIHRFDHPCVQIATCWRTQCKETPSGVKVKVSSAFTARSFVID